MDYSLAPGSWVRSFAYFFSGVCIGAIALRQRRSISAAARDAVRVVATGQSLKMVLCVRTDLKMRTGKIASQCAHGAVSAFGHASKDSQYANLAEEWFVSGQKKIVVRVDDLETLQSLHRKARELGLPRHIVVDAGRTQVAPSTPTVLAIGPASATEIDKITGNCKLYS